MLTIRMLATHVRPPTSIQAGFVLHSKPSIFFPPNMTFGRGCCGSVTPEGSPGPGRMLMGNDDDKRSDKSVERVLVGCEE